MAPLDWICGMTETSAGDPIPAHCEIIEVRVAELRHLFNPIDPTPFHKRDLDPRVEEFIVEWSREVSRQVPLALLVRLDRPAGTAVEVAVLGEAIRGFFAARALASRRRLRRLLHLGRISLAIGLAVLVIFTGIAQVLAGSTTGGGFGRILEESLSIGGWVAMWRPLEVFLYDWWPIRTETKLFEQLAAMPVRISYESGAAPEYSQPERIR
jgi:hypothetical protein